MLSVELLAVFSGDIVILVLEQLDAVSMTVLPLGLVGMFCGMVVRLLVWFIGVSLSFQVEIIHMVLVSVTAVVVLLHSFTSLSVYNV